MESLNEVELKQGFKLKLSLPNFYNLRLSAILRSLNFEYTVAPVHGKPLITVNVSVNDVAEAGLIHHIVDRLMNY